ncbi:M20 family metallopeptidase [Halobacillus sp. BBL2006]|uniref:M20 metallopeptidase family protein n=1 Tax=Halobacillus sp. BBL2006 TaxID=1543706 RepID=UPI0005433B88|nr:amidohydrolase [Halobacillus sp. BBL2006]KHE72809.1 peptidase M20 [Halobacillus sp. BBL2006]
MATVNTDLVSRSKQLHQQLVKWRRDFHQYPELSFQEKRTSEQIEKALRSIGGYEIEKGVGGYGIIATLHAGEGPVIGLRADMDALPIHEQTHVPYKSRYAGAMHACGHDAHTAILLGTAQMLSEDFERGALKGTIKLIFQPAEENCDETGETGAVKMLKSGRLNDLEAVLALHMCPWRKRGEIQVHDGPSMANNDDFQLTIKGTGGHAGYPQHVTDPVWIATYLLQALYSLNGRKIDPLQVGTLSVGQIHGGDANNIIPDSVEIKGTMRSYTNEIREKMISEIHRAAEIVTSLGGRYELKIHRGEPALINDPFINEIIRKSAFPIKIFEGPFGMGSEDFSHFTEKTPGAMFFLGCGLNEEKSLHQSDFDIDEEAMHDGVRILTQCVYEWQTLKGGRV